MGRNCIAEPLPKLRDLTPILAQPASNFRQFFETLWRPHGYVHGFVGGLMGDIMTSGMTPEFFLHHNNVDRIWTNWQLKSENHELAQSATARENWIEGSNPIYTIEQFTRSRHQAGICVEYDDHIEFVQNRRQLSAKSTKLNLVVDMTN